ncbi:hypothetical protein [Corallococcus llansteffanensis]|uniref:hypothetical protein n=1 Tax=Corallococcus llansteffanensis TaxID=2316731 RepID=UPI001FC99AC9|nr:hypothetical protein [Corallococcus llansteffanensis]
MPIQLKAAKLQKLASGPGAQQTLALRALQNETVQDEPPVVKRVQVVGPPQKSSSKPIACCGWAEFSVAEYSAPLSEEGKKKTKWLIRDAKTKATLPLPSCSKAEGARLRIERIPDNWEGKTLDVHAYLQSPKDDVKASLTVRTSGQVGQFIERVRMAELAYPSWSGEQLVNSLRRVAGYDANNFRSMYGGLPRALELTPSGMLTKADIDSMQLMTRHRVDGCVEFGIATDALGESVALGHVLTGISGGQHRNKNIDLTPSLSFGGGELMDNLYAVTIAGDLGQMAVIVHHEGAAAYIGFGTDATDAELTGDIDGFLLGDRLRYYAKGRSLNQAGTSGATLSGILHDFYCVFERGGAHPNTAADRYLRFSKYSRAELLDQTKRFATNYAYATQGKWAGMSSDADEKDSDNAVAAFWTWLAGKVTMESGTKK